MEICCDPFDGSKGMLTEKLIDGSVQEETISDFLSEQATGIVCSIPKGSDLELDSMGLGREFAINGLHEFKGFVL